MAYGPHAPTPADRLFQLTAFRTFSNIHTWEGVKKFLGHAPTLRDLASGDFEKALEHTKHTHGTLYTGAFILCANKAFGFDEKHKNHVALFSHMFLRHSAADKILSAKSLQQIVHTLSTFPLIGPFMSYQIAIDLNYSALINFSENNYTQAGPGALRGLRKVFLTLGDYSPADAIAQMVENQETEFRRLGLPFGGLWGRPLHAIDCQGLFCEVDKYCRQALPHLASNRTRIKAKFQPSGTPLNYFFPPKWGLNDRIRVSQFGK